MKKLMAACIVNFLAISLLGCNSSKTPEQCYAQYNAEQAILVDYITNLPQKISVDTSWEKASRDKLYEQLQVAIRRVDKSNNVIQQMWSMNGISGDIKNMCSVTEDGLQLLTEAKKLVLIMEEHSSPKKAN